MSHYYDESPDVKSKPSVIDVNIENVKLRLKTDSGVFSKNELDFGSFLLAKNIKLPSIEGDIIDVGCGYGVLGLFLAYKYKERKIDLIDVNERAIDLTKNNIELNNLVNANVFKSNFFENISKKYALIISNPPIRIGKDKIINFIKESINYLNSGGILYLVIRKNQGALSYVKVLEEVYSNYEIIEKKKGFYVIKTIRK